MFINKILAFFDLHISRTFDPIMDNDQVFIEIYNTCKPFTMTTKERAYALYQSVRYIIHNDVPGDFVECGVWKGGSIMLMIHTLQKMGIKNRRIFLYDTFSGMSSPSIIDKKIKDPLMNSTKKWQDMQKNDHNAWCYASLQEVQNNINMTNYPQELIFYIKGRVEETLPAQNTEKIALLRLDTDWYSSTKHELTHLYPLILHNGIIIIDDYGDWHGAQRATNEYFRDAHLLFHRIDRSGIIATKNIH